MASNTIIPNPQDISEEALNIGWLLLKLTSEWDT